MSSDSSSTASAAPSPELPRSKRLKRQISVVAESIQRLTSAGGVAETQLNPRAAVDDADEANRDQRFFETPLHPNGFGDYDDGDIERPRTRQLRAKKKLREFYTAPITKFWLWSITYFAFLVVFTYTMLIATPPTPEWHEIYVIVFMATFGCEKIREIFASEPVKLRQKLSVWSSSIWNCCDAFFVLFFFVAFSLRMQDGHTLEIGRVLYCLNIIYWYLKK